MTVVLFSKHEPIGKNFCIKGTIEYYYKPLGILTDNDILRFLSCTFSLISGKSLGVLNTFGDSKGFVILNEIKDEIAYFLSVNNSIVWQGESAVLFIKNMFETSFANIQILTETRDVVSQFLKIFNAIDWQLNKNVLLPNDFDLHGFSRILKISNNIEQTFILADSPHLQIESATIKSLGSPGPTNPDPTTQEPVIKETKDITSLITNAEIVLFDEGSILSSFTCDLATDQDIAIDEIKFTIQGIDFVFTVDEREFDKKNNKLSLWGRAKACKFFEPYAEHIKVEAHYKTASEVVNDILTGEEVIYNIDDWLIEKVNKDNIYPLEFVRSIAETVGGVLRCLPDNKIYLEYPDSAPGIEVWPIFTLKKKVQPATVDCVEVTSNNEGELYIEADKTEVQPGEWAIIKVYSRAPYNITTTADVLLKGAKKVGELVTEEITIEDGSGALKKPVYEILDVRGCGSYEVKGQYIYTDDCVVIEVDYKTYYDEYKVTNYTEAKKLVCSVATQNAIITGSGGGRKTTITVDYATEQSILQKKANRELELAQKTVYYEVETLFDPNFFAPKLSVMIDGKLCEVYKNVINIQTKPLKITSTLGARACLL